MVSAALSTRQVLCQVYSSRAAITASLQPNALGYALVNPKKLKKNPLLQALVLIFAKESKGFSSRAALGRGVVQYLIMEHHFIIDLLIKDGSSSSAWLNTTIQHAVEQEDKLLTCLLLVLSTPQLDYPNIAKKSCMQLVEHNHGLLRQRLLYPRAKLLIKIYEGVSLLTPLNS